MKEVENYIILISEKSHQDLANKVQFEINENRYQPIGGVTMSYGGGWLCAQAMVLYVNEGAES